MARESILSRVPIAASQVFRINGELESADAAAFEYENAIRGFFRLAPGRLPRFDLMMLGLGADGHVASLFPGTRALDERVRLAVANPVDRLETTRITLTLPVLNEAARVMVLVQGPEKAQALAAVLHPESGRRPLPAQLIQPTTGSLTWLVDRSAASLL
jgi:6-phosphogluconolactonase